MALQRAAIALAALAFAAPAAALPAAPERVRTLAGGATFPFPYNWSKFPTAWFAANDTQWEVTGRA